MASPAPAQPAAPEVVQFQLDRADDGLYLSALVQMELTPVVEDAMLKGVPMFFVAEAEVFRDRWYWTDQKVASTARTFRLVFQPLTRRWRLNSTPGTQSDSGVGATLNQNFDSLAEAMLTLRRISRWKIAEPADVPAGSRHYVSFRFRLDVSQLPRPFQIGAVGQSDWNIGASATQRLPTEAP